MRVIHGPTTAGVTKRQRRLCSYCSPSIVGVVEPRTMRCAGHAARIGDTINAYKFMVQEPEGKIHSGDVGINVRTVLKWL